MLVDALLKGIAAGIIVSLPVGPVGALCMRRALFGGMVYGLITGSGAALADTLYGGLAGMGSTIIRNELLLERDWLGAAGGLFLLIAGCRSFFNSEVYEVYRPKPLAGERMAYAFGSTFLLTLANPFTIIVFVAIFSEMRADDTSFYGIAFLVTGVFLGSMLCWVGLCWTVKSLRRFGVNWLGHASSAVLMVSGAALLIVSALRLAAILS
jgi:threonine/homoserine/homoserine lactone efflux protein